jgi:hypothetical protein
VSAPGNLSAVPVVLGVPFEAVYGLLKIQLRQLDRTAYLNVTSIPSPRRRLVGTPALRTVTGGAYREGSNRGETGSRPREPPVTRSSRRRYTPLPSRRGNSAPFTPGRLLDLGPIPHRVHVRAPEVHQTRDLVPSATRRVGSASAASVISEQSRSALLRLYAWTGLRPGPASGGAKRRSWRSPSKADASTDSGPARSARRQSINSGPACIRARARRRRSRGSEPNSPRNFNTTAVQKRRRRIRSARSSAYGRSAAGDQSLPARSSSLRIRTSRTRPRGPGRPAGRCSQPHRRSAPARRQTGGPSRCRSSDTRRTARPVSLARCIRSPACT